MDPNVRFAAKPEEDVPGLFKRLGYPFQISKSALSAVGSPHTWPGLLAALTWLVELLTYDATAEESRNQVRLNASLPSPPCLTITVVATSSRERGDSVRHAISRPGGANTPWDGVVALWAAVRRLSCAGHEGAGGVTTAGVDGGVVRSGSQPGVNTHRQLLMGRPGVAASSALLPA